MKGTSNTKNKAIIITVILNAVYLFPQKEEEFSKSLITDIFGGTLQSVLSKQGLTASASIEPFYCLHLDIHPPQVNSLQDGFNLLTSKEKIEGYHDTKKGTEVIQHNHSFLQCNRSLHQNNLR